MTRTSPEPTRPTDHAWRSPRAWLLLLIVMCLGLIADLGSKRWAFENVADTPVVLNRDLLLADTDYSPIPWQHVHGPGTSVLPFDLLEFKLVLNRGAVFGIGPDKRYFFIAFTIIALAGGLLVFGRMTAVRHRFAHIAIGMILAGGIGNLYDRLFVGRVRDFLHMLPNRRLPFGWNWPGGNTEIFPWIFNVADVMLLAGVLLLMLHINAVEKEHHKARLAQERKAAEEAKRADTPSA
ncbi:MAG: signal peptidase II [Phycisphaerales bacterium]|nr:signal peptidase II [Phycisphaerales bacterium]